MWQATTATKKNLDLFILILFGQILEKRTWSHIKVAFWMVLFLNKRKEQIYKYEKWMFCLYLQLWTISSDSSLICCEKELLASRVSFAFRHCWCVFPLSPLNLQSVAAICHRFGAACWHLSFRNVCSGLECWHLLWNDRNTIIFGGK